MDLIASVYLWACNHVRPIQEVCTLLVHVTFDTRAATHMLNVYEGPHVSCKHWNILLYTGLCKHCSEQLPARFVAMTWHMHLGDESEQHTCLTSLVAASALCKYSSCLCSWSDSWCCVFSACFLKYGISKSTLRINVLPASARWTSADAQKGS